MFSQYIIYAIGAAFVLALIGAGVQTWRLQACQKDLEAKKVLIIQQQSAIAQRDAVIEQVAAQGKATAERAQLAVQKAERGRAMAQEAINEMVAAPVPTAPTEQIQYMYGVADKLNKAWENGE